MAQKKYNVRLHYSWYDSGSTEPMDCGSLPMQEINQYLARLSAKKNIPRNSCVRQFKARFENQESATVYLCHEQQCPNAPHREESGRLNLYMTNKNNSKCNGHDCFNNIRNGKCTDAFVIEIIGKEFFENKYDNTNQKQR